MARHTATRRPRQKQEEPVDPVLGRILLFTEWARRNARIVIAVGVVLALVVLALLYYARRQSLLEQTAATQLASVRQTAASGNTALAIRDLETFLQRFGATSAGAEGAVLLAEFHLVSDQPSNAIEMLEDFETDDPLLRGTAGLLLASAYEEAANLPRAEEAYLRAAETAEYEYQRREGLEDAARLRLQQGDAAGAAELYARLVELMGEEDEATERGIY
ncbi:MAG: tetratricopeptide repeat protein, partial [Longimicrobiales bacterium]